MTKEESIKFLGIITARGGSKGIPKKNLRNLVDKPLIEYTFDAVKGSKLLSRCIVSTEDDEIIKFSKSKNMEVPFKRPEKLALDDSKSIDVLIHAVNYLEKNENYVPEYVVLLQPTSPLRTGEDINNAINLIKNNRNSDSLVSAIEIPHNFNPYSVMKYDGQYLKHYIEDVRLYRREEKPIFYARNGPAIYISTYDLLMTKRKIIGDKCIPYFMPIERSIDIDTLFDWKIAEFLIKNRVN